MSSPDAVIQGYGFEPDEELVEKLNDIAADALSRCHDPFSNDDEDTVTVCQVCGDVEGHRPLCPVPPRGWSGALH